MGTWDLEVPGSNPPWGKNFLNFFGWIIVISTLND